MTLLNANHLCQQSVHQVAVVLRLVCFTIRHQPKLDELRVGNIVKAEEVGACLFECASVGTEGIGINVETEDIIVTYGGKSTGFYVTVE